jgi:hypothetical protein
VLHPVRNIELLLKVQLITYCCIFIGSSSIRVEEKH